MSVSNQSVFVSYFDFDTSYDNVSSGKMLAAYCSKSSKKFKTKKSLSRQPKDELNSSQPKVFTFTRLHSIAEIINQIFLQINFAKTIECVV